VPKIKRNQTTQMLVKQAFDMKVH